MTMSGLSSPDLEPTTFGHRLEQGQHTSAAAGHCCVCSTSATMRRHGVQATLLHKSRNESRRALAEAAILGPTCSGEVA